MSFTGTNQPQSYGPPGSFPPPPRKRLSTPLVATIIGLPLVVVLVAVIVLSRAGVGPFAKKVPEVPALAEWPATVGELRLVGDKKPAASPLGSLDWDWEVSGRYSTGEGDDLVEHQVRVVGSTDKVKDVIGDYDVDEIGAGYCGSSILGRFLTRQCGVNQGSIVAVVESPPVGPSDEELIRYADSLANAVS